MNINLFKLASRCGNIYKTQGFSFSSKRPSLFKGLFNKLRGVSSNTESPNNIVTDKNEQKILEEELQNELKETDTEIETKLKREELIKLYNSTYTQEELDKINSKDEDITLMEIKPQNLKQLLLAKRLSLFFNLPLSAFLTIYCEYNLGIEVNNEDTTGTSNTKFYYFLFFVDYMLFLNGCVVLYGLRNIVLLAQYIPAERVIEFTKLSMFCKEYTKKIPIDELKRVSRSPITPFLALKNKKTNEDFSMFSVGIWRDITLFNTLFPKPKKERNPKREPKHPINKI
jgi:hypothetical protein